MARTLFRPCALGPLPGRWPAGRRWHTGLGDGLLEGKHNNLGRFVAAQQARQDEHPGTPSCLEPFRCEVRGRLDARSDESRRCGRDGLLLAPWAAPAGVGASDGHPLPRRPTRRRSSGLRQQLLSPWHAAESFVPAPIPAWLRFSHPSPSLIASKMCPARSARISTSRPGASLQCERCQHWAPFEPVLVPRSSRPAGLVPGRASRPRVRLLPLGSQLPFPHLI